MGGRDDLGVSTRKRLLAWNVVSRGSRTGTQVSMLDVLAPAVLTPGTTGLIVLHNHPSGATSPSVDDDIAITRRLHLSAAILGIDLLDHLIVGDEGRYYRFREAGPLRAGVEDVLTACATYAGQRLTTAAVAEAGSSRQERGARLGLVKARREASTPRGWAGDLDQARDRARTPART